MKINRYIPYIQIASMSLSTLIGGCNYHSNIDEVVQNSFKKAQKTTHEVIDNLFSSVDSTTTESEFPNYAQPKESYSPRTRNKFLVKQNEEARERIRNKSRLPYWEQKELRAQARQEMQRKYEEWIASQPDSIRFRDKAVQEVNSMIFHPSQYGRGTGEVGTYGQWIDENWSAAKRESTIKLLIEQYTEEARQEVVADSVQKSRLSHGESPYTVEIRAPYPK